MPLRLFNSLTRRVEAFTPGDPAHITFYTCGPTVYDDAHIGNFRSFLAADLLRRWLESPLCDLENETPAQRAAREATGRRVTHVMNITDVGHMTDDAEGGEHGEDRMAVAGRRIAEAKKAGKLPADSDVDPADPYQIAGFYEMRFREDAKTLGLKVSLEADRDESLHPKATANVPGMIEVVKHLLARPAGDGSPYAYIAGRPGARAVYFRVQAFGTYGRLSGNTLEHLREGEGGRISAENQAGKQHPADFLLWKEDPSHIMKWESPWGVGYPGWHIECTVMSVSRLLRTRGNEAPLAALFKTPLANGQPLIDLHSGGEDNIFPHHECEIAQSCCAFNAEPAMGTFARHWFHPRFLLVEGAKMSKSKGNFHTPRDLFARGIEPAALRLELIKTHYRSNANFTEQGLKDSRRMLDRWRRVAAGTQTPASLTPDILALPVCGAFADAMNDDLNIAGALAAVNSWVGELGPAAPRDAGVMRLLDDTLGVLSLPRPLAHDTDIALFAPGLAPDPAVVALLHDRRAARAARDFARSDQIRDQLAALGYAIKDVPGGKVEVTRG